MKKWDRKCSGAHGEGPFSIEEQVTGVYIVCKYAKKSTDRNKMNIFLV